MLAHVAHQVDQPHTTPKNTPSTATPTGVTVLNGGHTNLNPNMKNRTIATWTKLFVLFFVQLISISIIFPFSPDGECQHVVHPKLRDEA